MFFIPSLYIPALYCVLLAIPLFFFSMLDKGKIRLIYYIPALLYFITIGLLFGFMPDTIPIFSILVVLVLMIIGEYGIIAKEQLGLGDKIFLLMALFSIPAIVVLGALFLASIYFLLLSVLAKIHKSTPVFKPFMPYLFSAAVSMAAFLIVQLWVLGV